MKKNKIKNGVIIGSMVGLSVGMLMATNTKNVSRRKIIKTARESKSTVVNGIKTVL